MYILRNKYIFFVKGLNVEHPSGGVLVKRCSEKMQQIYRRAPMRKCDFNKVALQLHWNTLRHSNFDELTLPHGCSLVNLLHIFRTPFTKNTSGGVLLFYWVLNTPLRTVHFNLFSPLNISWRRSQSYRNQSMDWFLYHRNLRHERVKQIESK